jgi:effector-binding domain-containing protein
MISHTKIAILALVTVLWSTVRAGEPKPSEPAKLDIQLKDVKKQTTLVMKKTVKPTEIAGALGQIFPQVFQYLADHNIQPASAPMAKYKTVADGYEMEAGVVVPGGTKGNGDIVVGELAAGKAAFVVHVGRYEKLPGTYKALDEWLKAKGYRSSGIHWEIYISDPTQTKPDETKTECYLLAEPEKKDK